MGNLCCSARAVDVLDSDNEDGSVTNEQSPLVHQQPESKLELGGGYKRKSEKEANNKGRFEMYRADLSSIPDGMLYQHDEQLFVIKDMYPKVNKRRKMKRYEVSSILRQNTLVAS